MTSKEIQNSWNAASGEPWASWHFSVTFQSYLNAFTLVLVFMKNFLVSIIHPLPVKSPINAAGCKWADPWFSVKSRQFGTDPLADRYPWRRRIQMSRRLVSYVAPPPPKLGWASLIFRTTHTTFLTRCSIDIKHIGFRAGATGGQDLGGLVHPETRTGARIINIYWYMTPVSLFAQWIKAAHYGLNGGEGR